MKTKKISLMFLLILFIFLLKLNAQITTNEMPISLESRNKINLEKLSSIELKVPDLQKIIEEDKISDELYGLQRFSYPIMTNFNLYNSGHWTTFDDGSKLWRLELVLQEALSTHTIYDKFWLPDGSKFFVYNEKTGSYIGAITSEYISGTKEDPKTFTTGILLGEHIIYEYYQPASVKETPIIEISRIDYGYRFINYTLDAVRSSKNDNSFQGFNDAGSCQTNINCQEGNNWQQEKNAVVRILVVLPGHGSGWASGFLINNVKNDYTPYLLTANHCLCTTLGTQILDALGNSDANWTFYWHYEHPGCSNSNTEPQHFSTVGATVIANDHYASGADFALLKLIQDPRYLNGVTPYYLGWDATGNAGTGGVCIHHPQADVKKISTYSMTPQSTPFLSNNVSATGNYWRILWIETLNGRHSVVETYSSGSPLISNNYKVIGQLTGGYTSCSKKSDPSWFGKFSVSWNANSNVNRQLKHWLAPSPSTATSLDGLCWFTLVTGAQTTRKVECREIQVQDATVPSGITLELQATEKVIINSGTVIQSGATFIIW